MQLFKGNLTSFVDLVTVGTTDLAYIDAEQSKLNVKEKKLLNKLKRSECVVHKQKILEKLFQEQIWNNYIYEKPALNTLGKNGNLVIFF